MTKTDISVYISRLDQSITSAELLLAAAKNYAKVNQITFPKQPQLMKTALGKPYFTEVEEVKFSLSHSGGYWVAAFGRAELGIDLQKHVECRREALARRYFHQDEYQWLQELDFAPFFALWAAKESYAKYTGEGLSSFQCFTVVNDGGIAAKVNNASLRFMPFKEGYTLCLCADDPGQISMAENWSKSCC